MVKLPVAVYLNIAVFHIFVALGINTLDTLELSCGMVRTIFTAMAHERPDHIPAPRVRRGGVHEKSSMVVVSE